MYLAHRSSKVMAGTVSWIVLGAWGAVAPVPPAKAADLATFSVMGVGDSKVIDLKVSGPELHQSFLLNLDGTGLAAAVKSGLTVEVDLNDPLATTDSGKKVLTALNDPSTEARGVCKKELKASQVAMSGPSLTRFPLEFRLTACLPHEGTYSGAVRVAASGSSTPIVTLPLSVTRGDAPVPVVLESYAVAPLIWKTSDIAMKLSSRSTSVVGLTNVTLSIPAVSKIANLTAPTIASASSSPKEVSDHAVKFTVAGPSGFEASPPSASELASGTVAANPGPASGSAPNPGVEPKATCTDSNCVLAYPNDKTPVEAHAQISGLAPGYYAASVQFLSPDNSKTTALVAFAVRSPCWVAAGFILAGSIVAAVLQYFLKKRLPRLAVRQFAAQLLWQSAALRQQFEFSVNQRAVLASIEGQIGVARDKIYQWGLPNSPDACKVATDALQVQSSKLDLFTAWVNAQAQLAAVQDLDVPQAQALQSKLDSVRTSLSSDSDNLVNAKAILDSIGADIQTAQSTAYKALMDALSAQAGAFKQTLPAGSNAAVTAQLVTQALAAAQRSWIASDWDHFTSAYDLAGLRFAVAQGLNLSAQIPAKDVGKPQWATVLAKLDLLAQATSADTAQKAYNDALAEFESVHEKLLAANAQPGGPVEDAVEPAQRSTVKEQMQEVTRVLDQMPAASPATKRGLLRDATSRYVKALVSVPNPAKRAEFATAVTLPEASSAPVLVRRPTIVRIQPLSARFQDSLVSLKAKTVGTKAIVWGLAATIAVVAGLQIVWVPAVTWGSASDWIAAFFWGLGLHTASTSTFSSVMGDLDPH